MWMRTWCYFRSFFIFFFCSQLSNAKVLFSLRFFRENSNSSIGVVLVATRLGNNGANGRMIKAGANTRHSPKREARERKLCIVENLYKSLAILNDTYSISVRCPCPTTHFTHTHTPTHIHRTDFFVRSYFFCVLRKYIYNFFSRHNTKHTNANNNIGSVCSWQW